MPDVWRTDALRLLGATVVLPAGRGRAADRGDAAAGHAADPCSLPAEQLPVELAAAAARQALRRAALSATQVEEVLFAWTYDQGHPFWSPADRLARLIGTRHAVPVDIQQCCDGAAAALHLLRPSGTGPDPRVALIATGDVHTGTGTGTEGAGAGADDGATEDVRGHVGTAVVAVRGGPPITHGPVSTVRAYASAPLEHLETPSGGAGSSPVAAHRTSVVAGQPGQPGRGVSEALPGEVAAALGRVLPAVLDQLVAGGVPALTAAHLPCLEPASVRALYAPVVQALSGLDVVTSRWGTGHLGAGDLVANLAAIQRDVAAGAGPRSDLLVSAGGGYTVSAAVITTVPGELS